MPDAIRTALDEPLIRAAIAVCGGLLVLVLLARLRRGHREARYAAQRRQEIRARHGYQYMQQQELQRLGARIVATSSQTSIAGFQIVRQIEALFTDGHPTAAAAVDVLKAMAAEKGANALINLDSQRQGNQRFSAKGDAVLVAPSVAPPGPGTNEKSS